MNDLYVLDEYELSLIEDFNVGKSPRTKHTYRRELNAFKKHFNKTQDKSLLEATPQDGSSYIAFLRNDGKASGTIRRIYDQLNTFFNNLFLKGLIKGNPFHKIDKPRSSKQIRPERTPSPEELEKLLRVLKENFESRDLAAIVLIATTGRKVSEILSTKWSSIVHAEDHIGLKISDDPPKFIKLYDFVWELIDQYRRQLGIPNAYLKKDYYVFIRYKSLDRYFDRPYEVKHITPDWIRKVMERACHLAEIPLYTAKDLRHAFAVYTLNLGIRSGNERAEVVTAVSEQLGLSNENQIEKYKGLIEQLMFTAGGFSETFYKDLIEK